MNTFEEDYNPFENMTPDESRRMMERDGEGSSKKEEPEWTAPPNALFEEFEKAQAKTKEDNINEEKQEMIKTEEKLKIMEKRKINDDLPEAL